MIDLYERFIYNILSSKFKRILVISITLLLFFGSILMFPTKLVLAKMLPGKSANSFSIYIDTPDGSSIFETTKITKCLVNIITKEKEVLNISTYLGSSSPLDYAGLAKGSIFKNAENVSEMVINLTDKSTREEASFSMVHRLRPVLKENCSSLVNGTVIKMIEQPAGPPTLASIVVEVYGKGENLHKISEDVKNILQNTEHLVDVDKLSSDSFSKFELSIDKDKVLRSGLGIEQVNKILYLAFEGSTISSKNSYNSPDQIAIFLVLDKKSRTFDSNDITSFKNKLSSLKLMNSKGMMVPMDELVSVEIKKSYKVITQKNLKTYVNVIAEADLVSQVYPLLDAKQMMEEHFKNEYDIETYNLFNMRLTDKKTKDVYELVWDGEMKVTLDTFIDLGGAFIAALILVFFLIVVYYKSFKLSGIVLAGSFLSIIGVIFGHWLIDIFTRDSFFLTATSLIGFIALIGINSRNSLLLIDFTKLLMKDGHNQRRALAISTATRIKPIFLTAITIVLASILLVSDPIFGGLGVALIFGSMVALLVSIIFVPVLIDGADLMDKE